MCYLSGMWAALCVLIGLCSPPVAEVRGVMAEPSGTSKKAAGGLPVTLAINLPGAVDVRMGNTPVETTLSSWQEYQREIPWLLPTSGPWGQVVHIEARLADGSVQSLKAPVPSFGWLTPDYIYPQTEFRRAGPVAWEQKFSQDAGRWMAYSYFPDGTHTFYPASHEVAGGPDGGGYIWMDYSRTSRDAPDANSFLVLINYAAWIEPLAGRGEYRTPTIDLGPVESRPRTARFQLRSDCPDLKGGSYHFWVLGAPGRMHKTGQPLVAGNGEWGPVQEIELSDPAQWTVTHAKRPSFDAIESFGISLLGATEKPADACKLSLGPISIGF